MFLCLKYRCAHAIQCVCAMVHEWRSEGDLECGSSPFLRQDLLPFTTACVRLPGLWASRDYIHELLFWLCVYVCSGDLNLGPYTGQASTLPREPSPRPSLVTLYTLLKALIVTVFVTHFVLVCFLNLILLHQFIAIQSQIEISYSKIKVATQTPLQPCIPVNFCTARMAIQRSEPHFWFSTFSISYIFMALNHFKGDSVLYHFTYK